MSCGIKDSTLKFESKTSPKIGAVVTKAEHIEAFKQTLTNEGVTIKTNCAITEVLSKNIDKPSIMMADGQIEEYDEVIITLPAGLASQLCPELSGVEKNKLENVDYLGVICVAVLLDKSISDFYVTNITDTWVPFTGVIEMTALVDKKYMDGKALIYLPKYVVKGDPLFDESDECLKKYFIENLKKMYPEITDDLIRFVGVAKAKNVITVAKLNYSELLPGIKTSVPNVYFINTSHIKDGTLNVNETVRVAEDKLHELLLNSSVSKTKPISPLVSS